MNLPICSPCLITQKDRWRDVAVSSLPARTQRWCRFCCARHATMLITTRRAA